MNQKVLKAWKAWKAWNALPAARQKKIIEAFYQSALYLKERMDRDRWEWSWNYLREHARCAFHVHVTNTPSPAAYIVLREQHPDIAHFKEGQQGNLFAQPSISPADGYPPNGPTVRR